MNVAFIVLDTVRKDRISVYNEEVDFTENIEEFAEDATVFDDAVSQAPWTLPSHGAMFTGQYPWQHGATQKQLFLDTDRELLAEKFEKKGYRTACFTSNTWISPYTGMSEGFQEQDNFFGVLPSNFMGERSRRLWEMMNTGKAEWLMDNLVKIGEKIHWLTEGTSAGSKTPRVVSTAENFIDENQDEDVFLFLNFMDCHLPYYPPEEYQERHAPDVDPSEICQKAHDHNGGEDEADFEASRKLYDAELDYLDDQLGRTLEIIEEKLEDTVIVVVADHGENLGEDGMFGHQFSVSEQLVSVPMMIKAPGLDKERIEQQVELRELYEAIPSLAGLEDSDYMFGSEVAKGGYEEPRLDLKNIPEELHEKLGSKLGFVRRDGFKAVRTGESVEVIDLSTGETVEGHEDLREMSESIEESEEGEMLENKDEEVKQRLEELGYI